MMRQLLTLAFLLTASIASAAGPGISLPSPSANGGLPVNQCFAERSSTRVFDSTRKLSLQTVADLLWATCGINRPESGLRTNPTARNYQEIEAYWFDADGVYYYNYKNNELIEKAKGDHRNLVAGSGKSIQNFVLDAPGAVVIVADTAKSGLNASLIDAGIACENINIFCAGNGLATVPRMTMDTDGIRKLLSLPETAMPVMNNPVGYGK